MLPGLSGWEGGRQGCPWAAPPSLCQEVGLADGEGRPPGREFRSGETGVGSGPHSTGPMSPQLRHWALSLWDILFSLNVRRLSLMTWGSFSCRRSVMLCTDVTRSTLTRTPLPVRGIWWRVRCVCKPCPERPAGSIASLYWELHGPQLGPKHHGCMTLKVDQPQHWSSIIGEGPGGLWK